jgi:hypothetical protein
MSEMKIKDGSGKNKLAIVDSTQRLYTRSVSEDEWKEATINGDHYAVTSGAITLTSANLSAMLYFKNNEEEDLLIDRIVFNSDDSTGGTVDQFVFTMVKNPDGLGSGSGNDATIVNTNFASPKTLDIISEKGQEAATVTNGTTIAGWRIENPTRMRVVNVRLIMPKGSSIAFTVTPPASNTSMVAVVACNVHKIKTL